jgi:hypothetical protein
VLGRLALKNWAISSGPIIGFAIYPIVQRAVFPLAVRISTPAAANLIVGSGWHLILLAEAPSPGPASC